MPQSNCTRAGKGEEATGGNTHETLFLSHRSHTRFFISNASSAYGIAELESLDFGQYLVTQNFVDEINSYLVLSVSIGYLLLPLCGGYIIIIDLILVNYSYQ